MKSKVLIIVSLIIATFFSCNTRNTNISNDEKKDSINSKADSVKENNDSVKKEVLVVDSTCREFILNEVVKKSSAIAKSRKTIDAKVGKRSTNASDPSGFIVVSDLIPDVIMETRYYTSYNFVGTRVDGYVEPVAICSREAAKALKDVADDLRPKGYLIKIFDAYRPQKAVDHFCRWAKSKDTIMKEDFYPTLEKTSLFPGYIARKSGHTKGSTFDLTIVHADTKQDVDMGGTFDFFGTKSHYAYTDITKEQKANRKLLHDSMLAHGFKPYSSEWWHFTLKNEPYPNIYFTFPNDSKLIK